MNFFSSTSVRYKNKAAESIISSGVVPAQGVHTCSAEHDSATQWTAVHQVPLSMGFSRQEYWSGLPFPPLGDLPNPRIETASLASPVLAGKFFGTETPGKSLLFSQRWPMCEDVFGQGTFISGYVLPNI